MDVFGRDIQVIRDGADGMSVDAVVFGSSDHDQGESLGAVRVFAGSASADTGVDALRRQYADALSRVQALGVRSLMVVPFGFDQGDVAADICAKILAQELMKILRPANCRLERIAICLRRDELFEMFEKNLYGYLTHMYNTLGMGPYVTVDAVVEVPGGIVIIERSNPPYGKALPGGFVDYGESLETAVVREVREETGLEFTNIRQFRTYSDPGRDPRFHTVSTVFVGKGIGDPAAGDDAAALDVVPLDKLLALTYAFDHKQVMGDYLNTQRTR